MKKQLKMMILALLVPVFATITNGQDAGFHETMHIGVKGGLNYSNLYDTNDDELVADSKFGWAAGGFLSIPLGGFLGIQPEVLFSQKGFKKTSGSFLGTVTYTRTTTFIDVPIYLQIKPAPMVSIVAGPQFSFLTRTKDEYSDGSIIINNENEVDNDNIRKNILGISGGLDLYVSQLVISGRIGFDLQDNHGDGESSSPRYRNTWWQLTAGFVF